MGDIRTAAQREIRLDHLLGTFAVGSGDWSWQEEYDKLYERDYQRQLTKKIRVNGITEPILLGSDGRVWDGHHRICAAMHIGLDCVPVEFCTPERVTPTREQIAEVLAAQREPEYQHVEDEGIGDADAVLALMTELEGQ